MLRRSLLLAHLLAGIAAIALPGLALAQAVPAGYPADYAALIAAAKKEGTDQASAEPVLKGFAAAFPGITVEYNDLNSTNLYNRFISEAAANAATADFTWSSAMDLQMKLVADGYGTTYVSPEAKNLPGWAAYKNIAWGTTNEPLVFVYNKRLLPADSIPTSHADLAAKIAAKPDLWKGKLTMYDAEKSGVGFLLSTQDAAQWPAFWDLAAAFGKAGAKYYTSAGAMMEKVTSGEHLLAYNIFDSYALLLQKKDANLGIVYPADYSLSLSRIAFLPKAGKNPNAGKLFLDYVLSKAAQEKLANEALMHAVRADVGDAALDAAKQKIGAGLKPIPVSESLLDVLDQKKRLEVLDKWKKTARAG